MDKSSSVFLTPDFLKFLNALQLFLSDNQPPVLQNVQQSLQTFYREDFVYQFTAMDPEGSAIAFSLNSGPPGASLSPAGLLIWKAETNHTQKFTFSVTDDCSAEAKATIEVITFPVKCPTLIVVI